MHAFGQTIEKASTCDTTCRSNSKPMGRGAAYDVATVSGLIALAVVAGALLLAHRCAAQAPSGSGSGCMPELVSLTPCMDYMSGNATAPDGPCCSALSVMLRSSPQCVCMVLGGTAASLGVAIDSARALQLPGACNVQAPSASQCNAAAAGVPLPSPAAGTTTPPGTPAAATPSDANATPAGSGSNKATPTTVTQYSDGGISSRPRMIFVFVGGLSAMALLRHF